jgi:hypothetical protein
MFRNRKGVGVSPSPLNPVKLELAVIIVIGVLLWAAHRRMTTDPFYQLLIVGGYGVAAMAWLVTRTRRIMARHTAGPDPIPRSARGGRFHEPD